MFGTSPSNSPRDHEHVFANSPDSADKSSLRVNDVRSPDELATSPASSTTSDQSPHGERKRRGSRAREMLHNAKNSLHFPPLATSPDSGSHAEGKQQPLQKLGKTDPVLSVPTGSFNNSAGESQPGPRSTFRVGVAEDKNKKCRRTMEDTHAYLYNFLSTPAPQLSPSDASPLARSSITHNQPPTNGVVETDNGYFAIFDGHAGSFAADWCGKKVHVLLEDVIRGNPNTPIPELLDMTFTSVDQQLEKLPLKNSGCTAVIAVLRWEDRVPNTMSATGSTALAPAAAAVIKAGSSETDKLDATQDQASSVPPPSEARLREAASRQRVLYTANVGDARIVMCRSGKALRLSYDHKGSDESEGKRIAGAGGLILNNRVNGVLAVTRALGDAYMKELVTGHPYTTETVIQPDSDEFLILACDGLWDVCSDQEAVDMVRNIKDPQVAAKTLVDNALSRFSTDNLSCMIVRFDSQGIQRAVSHYSQPIGVDGDSSGKGGMSEAQALVDVQRKRLHGEGGPLERRPSNVMEEHAQQEAGPELNNSALSSSSEGKAPELPINTAH